MNSKTSPNRITIDSKSEYRVYPPVLTGCSEPVIVLVNKSIEYGV